MLEWITQKSLEFVKTSSAMSLLSTNVMSAKDIRKDNTEVNLDKSKIYFATRSKRN